VTGFLSADNLLSGQPLADRQCELLALYGSALANLYLRKLTRAELRAAREAEREFSERLAGLLSIAAKLSATESVDDLCRQAVEQAQRELCFERVGIWFATGQPFEIQGTFGTDERGALRDERAILKTVEPDSITGRVLSAKSRGFFVLNAPTDADGRATGPGYHAMAPLWSGAEVIGLISMDNRLSWRPLTEHDCELLALSASVLGSLATRKRAEEALRAQNELLWALDRVRGQFLAEEDPTALFGQLLADMLSLTQSEYGFVGEVLHSPEGAPYLRTYTLTNLAWNEETRRFYDEHAPAGLEFHNPDTLFGAALRTGEPVLANSPAADPRAGGLPEGHPPIDSFAALPFRCGGKLVGLAGVANRPGGYDQKLVDYLQPLLSACASIIEAHRNDQRRKQAEAALAHERDLLHALMDSLPDFVYFKDTDSRFLRTNPAHAAILGVADPQQAVGRTDAEFFPAEQARAYLRHDRAVVAGEPLRDYVEAVPTAAGETRWVSTTKAPIRAADGRVTGLVGVSRDITTRLQSQRDLETERERLAITLRTMQESLIGVDRSGRIVLLNDEARRLLGWPAAESAGKTLADAMKLLGAPDLAPLLAPQAGALPHEVVRAGPPRQVFEVSVSPVTEGPETGGWVILVHDATAEHDAQRQLVGQARLAAVGQLAAGMAHDFNNLLTGVVGYAELLQMRRDLPESAREPLQIIRTQGMRASALIRQVLDFSRSSIVQRRPLDLLLVLKETHKLLERTIEESVRLVLEVEPGDYTVSADVAQFQQVLTNLAVNARDVMPAGGELRFGLSRRTDAVRPRTFRAGEPRPFPDMPLRDWVVLRVSDTGTGMPPEVLEHVFEPFFTTKEVGKGTGLGLAQVYGIVKQHEGYIGVTSEPGRGTTFTIHLPALHASVVAPEEPAAAEIPRGKGETILIVEDEERVRSLLTELLEALNYRVLTATNGREALTVYEQRREEIALVLSDMTMPEMGGTALFRALRQLDPQAKVIVITGYPLREGAGELLDEGLLGWVQKPAPLPILARAVRKALDSPL
jgi:PAS domain S-box-containing protein